MVCMGKLDEVLEMMKVNELLGKKRRKERQWEYSSLDSCNYRSHCGGSRNCICGVPLSYS